MDDKMTWAVKSFTTALWVFVFAFLAAIVAIAYFSSVFIPQVCNKAAMTAFDTQLKLLNE